MPSLYTEIDINAPQSVVWDALIRKDQWRFWNTFLYDCDPSLRLARGNEIFLAMQRLEGDEETEFQPVITMLRPPSMLRWVSTIPGLRSEHVFELRENVPGRTHYIHREVFSGILSKVFLPFIRQDERQGLRRMSQQLKMHVEQTVLGNYPPARYSQERYPQATQDRYPQDRYPQDRYPQDSYTQDRYPQERYPQDRYPQDQYPQNTYPQNSYRQQPYPDPRIEPGTPYDQPPYYDDRRYENRPYDASRPPQPLDQPPYSDDPNYGDRGGYDDRGYDRNPPPENYPDNYDDRNDYPRDYPPRHPQ
jgi:hypothetical protein